MSIELINIGSHTLNALRQKLPTNKFLGSYTKQIYTSKSIKLFKIGSYNAARNALTWVAYAKLPFD